MCDRQIVLLTDLFHISFRFLIILYYHLSPEHVLPVFRNYQFTLNHVNSQMIYYKIQKILRRHSLIHYNTVSGKRLFLCWILQNAVNMAVKSCLSPLYLGKAAVAAFQGIKPTTCAVYLKYLPCLKPLQVHLKYSICVCDFEWTD